MPNETIFRPYTPEDLPFIYKSWIRTALAAKQYGSICRPFLADAVKQTIDWLLANGSTVMVSCWAEDPTALSGFVCFGLESKIPVIHFVYVKNAHRGHGVGSDLVAIGRARKPGKISYTFKTRYTPRVLREADYKPFLVREGT